MGFSDFKAEFNLMYFSFNVLAHNELVPLFGLVINKRWGIDNKKDAITFLEAAIDHPNKFVAVDCETTGLYPRDGYILGISVSYRKDHGAYILTDIIDEEIERLFQLLFDKKTVVFHNAKFDLAMLEYHFNFKFPKFEDTMLLHYCLEEQPGTHGLKQLATDGSSRAQSCLGVMHHFGNGVPRDDKAAAKWFK